MADLFDIVVARKLSGGGGGGGSWTVLTEEAVTTVAGSRGNMGELSYIFTSEPPETLRITFDGTAYECEAIVNGNNYLYGGIGPSGPDFSQYPFAIQANAELITIFTETAGTYTVKLEEQQGGGSSDFSTAQVTIIDNTSYEHEHSFDNFVNVDNGAPEGGVTIYGGSQRTVTAVLYQGHLHTYIETSDTITATGGIEVEADSGFVDLYITGDCTITIS